ncbi:hypothetical protein CWI36_2653p0010 [Hamiltosporidium magnivora]|uniref:Uncharacterized protein n=1 Tax=Hamiltosporidium magnivora TaxID=148818 RepID=A0A4Q9KSV8_9MICR|nr:hypothetical protein CWI36_2653p0010 [Hamiltosporidium magnivora]
MNSNTTFVALSSVLFLFSTFQLFLRSDNFLKELKQLFCISNLGSLIESVKVASEKSCVAFTASIGSSNVNPQM